LIFDTHYLDYAPRVSILVQRTGKLHHQTNGNFKTNFSPIRSQMSSSAKDAVISQLRAEIYKVKTESMNRNRATAGMSPDTGRRPASTDSRPGTSTKFIKKVWDDEQWNFGSHWRGLGKPAWMKIPDNNLKQTQGFKDHRRYSWVNGAKGNSRRRNLQVVDSSMDLVKTGSTLYGMPEKHFHVRG
jgi:hypothetical protein